MLQTKAEQTSTPHEDTNITFTQILLPWKNFKVFSVNKIQGLLTITNRFTTHKINLGIFKFCIIIVR